MTQQATIVPRVAFLINLAPSGQAQPSTGLVRQLARIFSEHRLPATWAISDAAQARQVGGSGELAIVVDWAATPQTTARFGEELGRRLAELPGKTSLVAGDPTLLGSRLAALSDHGVRGLIAMGDERVPAKLRPLPCGLWLLGPGIQLPKRRIARWLPARTTRVADLLAAAHDGNSLVSTSAAELERGGRRDVRAFESLIREVARRGAQEELRAARILEIVADLSARRTAKPQRSILRAAA